MNGVKNSERILCSRLGNCEVCDSYLAKYTCPQCEVKTCSLPCVNIHKKELLCNGQRNRVKYIPLNKFSTLDLQNDYILLEEAGRNIKRISSENKALHCRKHDLVRAMKLRKAARIRGVKYEFLPQKFTRHKENTTYLNWKTGELFWKIEWVFPEANYYTVSDPRVLDSNSLEMAVSKYISEDNTLDDSKEDVLLSSYRSAGKKNIKIILKAEKIAGNKFYETEIQNTISYNLREKVILEYPIFYVILKENLKNYDIVHEVPEILHQDRYFKKMNEKKSFFFSTAEYKN